MRAKWEISSRDEFIRDWKKNIVFFLFWASVSLFILIFLPERAWEIKFHGLIAIGIIGIWRYLWFLINVINAFIYRYFVFPQLKKKAFKSPFKYPKRVYFMIPSYKEDFEVSRQVFTALALEVYKIPSEVYVFVAVGSDEEAKYIERIIKIHDPLNRIYVKFLRQEMGKRVAMGHTLRAIARHFNYPLNWHEDYHNDVVIFMDGDTVLGRDVLRKTLPYFRTFPNEGAITTDEGINYLGKNPVIYLWYKLKFAQRHLLMMSHSLYKKVLTLTGRLSLFRAPIVLSEDFIRYIEADYLDHYLFGRFRFLMGDDKSTWFYLLKEGWDMLYIPDAIAWSTEDRSGNFFKVSASLMFRWYGNMLRNNWRAIKLGPKKIGSFFIWLAILDQRISMWTTLVGPVGVTLLSLFISPFYWAFYIVWVIWTRMMQILVIDLFSKLNPSIIHLLLLLYNQWAGAIIKIYASANLSKQRWAKKTSQAVEAQIEDYKLARKVLHIVIILFFTFSFIIFIGIYIGVFKVENVVLLLKFMLQG